MLQLVSRHVIEIQRIGFKSLVQSPTEWMAFIRSSWQCYYMLVTTKIVNAISSSGVVVILELFFLRLRSNCN